MLYIERFVNTPIESNTYIVSFGKGGDCIIIDPGNILPEKEIEYITLNNLNVLAILLTHEHFDHIYGINKLYEKFPNLIVYTSDKTLDRIKDCRKNLSFYYNQIEYEVINTDNQSVSEGVLVLGDFEIKVFETFGHTDSSLSFLIGSYLFTGDFYLKDPTVTKLKTGSKKDLEKSLIKMENIIKSSIICPGHGDLFKV